MVLRYNNTTKYTINLITLPTTNSIISQIPDFINKHIAGAKTIKAEKQWSNLGIIQQ